ncbi:YgiT-type zinc finger protein [Paenibacillus sp. HJL G12]|uniref:YgiT-type zinc finger protein n=1 Tax=Paenibacillus dendrobii TaxID=2691084 RepID=A0A7X3IJ78_9BACL|nr:helix-turn-helix domain-containing protein [Paenibacillus dendrobii]MWV44949.1 YgiT-type zinc finger protein [Paenibacillus dendrobii]
MGTLMSKCVECGSKDLTDILHTMEHQEYGKTFVIEHIPAIQCNQCKEIYLSPKASKYIDKQLAIFRNEGFENAAKEVVKSKGITQEELGAALGVTKQRANQILSDGNLDAQTMIRVSNVVNEPVEVLFKFRRITEKESKYYIV